MKQLTVFLENKEGRLLEVLRTLSEKNINLLTLSLADTSEYGLLRLLVSDPQLGYDTLKEKGFSVSLIDVIAITMPNEVGSLENVIAKLHDAKIDVEYMYALCTDDDRAAMVIKASDTSEGIKVLEQEGMEFYQKTI